MGKILIAEQIERYARDGVVHPVRVLDEAAARDYRAKFEAFETEYPEYMTTTKRQKLYLVLRWMNDLVRLPKVLDAVEDVLGPDLMCWQCGWFNKEAHDPGFVSWHQDGNYWGLSSHEVLTAWLALSPATVASGAMRMIPGSQDWPPTSHSDTFDENNLLSRGQVMDQEIDLGKAIDVEVMPGEISLHHVNVAHASAPNTTDDRRIALAIRYVTPRVHQVTDVPDSAMLVRDEDKHGNFELETPPVADFDPAAVALHDRVTGTRQGFIYKDAVQRPDLRA